MVLFLALFLGAFGGAQGQVLIDKGQSLNEQPPAVVLDLVARGIELTEGDRLDEAVAALKKAISLAPRYLRAHIEYRNVKGNYLGHLDDLKAEYESLIEKEPDNPVYLMAVYYLSNGSFGRDSLEKVAEIAPEWAWGHYAKALLLLDKEPEGAVGELLQTIEKEPSATEAYYLLISLQETKLNRIDDAIATAEKFAGRAGLRAKGLPALWRLRLKKANQSEEAKERLRHELQKLANVSSDVEILRSIRSAYTELLKDRESARSVEEKIRRIDPEWYPMRGWRFSRITFNESGVPRFIVLANRQLAIYNKVQEAMENPDPQERIRRLEDLLSLGPNPVLKRIIYEDIFRVAVKATDAAATLKYADALRAIDPSDTGVLAKAALVLANRRVDLKKALQYARVAEKATAEFQLAQRPPNTPGDIFEMSFPEQRQREAYAENRAVALHALGRVFYRMGNYKEAGTVLRKAVNAKRSALRLTHLAEALLKLGHMDEAEKLTAEASKQLAETVRRSFVNEPLDDFQLESINSRKYIFSALRGKVVLINFWATWCAPCREELPVLNRLYEKYRERGLEVLAVSTDEERKKVPRFVKEYRLTIPVFYDSGMKDYFNAKTIPTNIFIGREGKVRYRKIGFDEESVRELEAVIIELLK